MVEITFSKSGVARLLNLPDAAAVDTLVKAKILRVAGVTRHGRPLFYADDVRRAAGEIAFAEEVARRRAKGAAR